MRSVRRPDEYHDLLTRAATDRNKRVLTGVSDLADRNVPDHDRAIRFQHFENADALIVVAGN